MEGTCIKACRTKKPKDAKEWSWRERPFKVKGFPDCNIFPGVFDQGNRPVCDFCSITSAGQMEFNRAVAKTGNKCMFRLDWESLVKRFLELHGLHPLDGPDVRKRMEKELLGKSDANSKYVFSDAAAWCFKHLGIQAFPCTEAKTVPHQDDEEVDINPLNRNPLNLGLHDYKRYDTMKAGEVYRYVEEGRAIKTGILVGEEFHLLEPDEIYAWCPEIDMATGKWVEKPSGHGIVLLGNGDTGPELKYMQYHPFLNSHGDEYGDGGTGSVFYASLPGPFFLLDMKAQPKIMVTSMMEADHIPRPLERRNFLRRRFSSPPRHLPGPTPRHYGRPSSPPHGRPSSPPRHLPGPTRHHYGRPSSPPHVRPSSPPRHLPSPSPRPNVRPSSPPRHPPGLTSRPYGHLLAPHFGAHWGSRSRYSPGPCSPSPPDRRHKIDSESWRH